MATAAPVQSIKIDNKRKTRSKSEYFLIGRSLDRLTGSQLPTKRQVLQYFLHLKDLKKSSQQQVFNNVAAYDTIDGTFSFWAMARIKTISHNNAEEKLIKLWKKYRNICKRTNSTPEKLSSRQSDFHNELNELFDVAARDAIEEIKNNRLLNDNTKKEDIEFLKDQRTDRKMKMSGHDKIYAEKYGLKIDREQKMQIRAEKEILRLKYKDVPNEDNDDSTDDNIDENDYDKNDMIMEMDQVVSGKVTEDGPTGQGCSQADMEENYMDVDYNDSDFEYIANEKKDNFETNYVILKCPRKIVHQHEICSTADRLAVSDNVVTALLASFLLSCGADLNDFSISRQTTRRSRIGNTLLCS